MESALTTVPPSVSASSSASRDLPLAVGPAIRIAFLMRPSPPDLSMPLVATLISHPAARRLSQPLATMASQAVGASAISWLGRDVACDLALPTGIGKEEAAGKLHERLSSKPIDVVVHDASVRRKKILLADMDSTMIDQECIDE